MPEIDVREVRRKMGLNQAQFATKFGLPPATLRNWEQGRSRPDAPTRVLLAVIAKHPEAVEDVLRKASQSVHGDRGADWGRGAVQQQLGRD
ncbi:MAG TPA: helix-turn-helix domain-containing protein [Bryobacteraceae bacterium]|nr:helix-turn-helix domain-containing protein [Bryobacteraceae bacterium]HOL72386.1 helix-turn-helix domain-containing protein [Bryobacteraceae bacterium]HOQ46427.1 helix-turn-helix domain-containing protein [Bryobacteraceae bacterium]HPU72588.1 helix-turn-helix domain-containing protein [Bryobacteraceae bacterium]